MDDTGHRDTRCGGGSTVVAGGPGRGQNGDSTRECGSLLWSQTEMFCCGCQGERRGGSEEAVSRGREEPKFTASGLTTLHSVSAIPGDKEELRFTAPKYEISHSSLTGLSDLARLTAN